MTRVIAAAAALAFVAGLMSLAVDGGRSDGGEGVHLVVPSGAEARIDGPGRRDTVGPGRYRVADGDTVTAVTRAATLELAEGASIELREGFVGAGADRAAPSDTSVRVAPTPVLLGGEALVVADDELAVSARGTVVRVEAGAARLHRSLTFTAAVYGGRAVIESAGREAEVPALRQAAVPGLGLVPGRPVPLVYDELDPWDQRHLGEAIDLTRVLDARSRGFTAQLTEGDGTTPGFYAVLYSELEGEPTFATDVFRATRAPGELLVGTAIALEAADGDLADRLREAFSFRDEGAEWGLVALDLEVARAPLLARIDAAFDRSPLLFAGGPPPPAPGDAPPPPPPEPDEPDDPVPTSPPPEEPPEPPPDDPVDDVVDLVGDLLSGDDDDGGDTGTPVDPLVGTLVEVVEDTTDTLGSLTDSLG